MKFFRLFVIIPVLVSMVACNKGGTPVVKRTEADAARKAARNPQDSTLIVTLEFVEGDSVGVVNVDTQREFTLSFADLKQNGENHGSLTQDNTLAVMADLKKKSISRYINLTEFLGLWLFSDESGNGVRFDDSGAASNIGAVNDITLRTWRVLNGRLLLSYVPSNGSDYKEKEDEATIVALTSNQLVFTFRGNQYTCFK